MIWSDINFGCNPKSIETPFAGRESTFNIKLVYLSKLTGNGNSNMVFVKKTVF